jgi:HEAT repeat protein
MSQAVIQQCYWVGGIFLALAVFNVVMSSVFRAQNYRKMAEWTRTRDEWKQILVETLYGTPTRIPVLRGKEESLRFIKLWSDYQDSVRGQATSSLNALATKLNLDSRCMAFAKSRNLNEKIAAIVALGHMREARAFSSLCGYIYEGHSVLSMVAARAMVQINAEEALPLLLPILPSRHDWPDYRIAMIFQDAGVAAVSKYLPDYLSRHNSKEYARLVQFLRYARPDVQMTAATQILTQDSADETKIECLPLLQRPEDAKYASAYLSHHDPRFRKMAIELIAKVGSDKDVSSLNNLAFDSNWGVRLNAIQTIARFDKEMAKLKARCDNDVTKEMIAEVNQ